jgi:hypothetical protein
MELNKVELENVAKTIKAVEERESAVRELADLELALVGGGVGDVQF